MSRYGLTPLCPYDLGSCWVRAYDGIHAISDIEIGWSVPMHDGCQAFFLSLNKDIVSDMDVRRECLKLVINQG